MGGRLDPLSAGLSAGATGLFTTRYGGVSGEPWAELNLATHVEDELRHVLANRDLLARELGTSWLNFPQQVHGAGVLVVDADLAGRRHFTRGGGPELRAPDVDALVTALPGVPIGILVADCLPVLIADIRSGVVGAAHAGRRGLAAGVLSKTLAAMVELGAAPADCVAVIGPAVCGQCYEVPAQMRDEVEALVPGSAATTRHGTPALDLAAGAAGVLRAAGVGEVNSSGICTVEDPRFFSYRRDGRTGRFAGIVMLEPLTDRVT
jgi:polyphenol oxidase